MPGNFYAHFAGRRCVMARSRIKGITVEIGGDTTKLQSALKGVNSEIKNTQSQLKDVEKLLKLDPGNTELLAQKQNCTLFIIERDMIVERTQEGRRLSGHYGGRPRKYKREQLEHAMLLLESNSYKQVSTMTGISVSTLYRTKLRKEV